MLVLSKWFFEFLGFVLFFFFKKINNSIDSSPQSVTCL